MMGFEGYQAGDLVCARLLHSATMIFGVVADAQPEGLTLRFPAELRGHSFMVAHAITRQPTLQTVPILFFLALTVESFGWDELASCHVLRDDDLDTRFDYARNVLATYRQNVARWSPEAVGVPTRLIETG